MRPNVEVCGRPRSPGGCPTRPPGWAGRTRPVGARARRAVDERQRHATEGSGERSARATSLQKWLRLSWHHWCADRQRTGSPGVLCEANWRQATSGSGRAPKGACVASHARHRWRTCDDAPTATGRAACARLGGPRLGVARRLRSSQVLAREKRSCICPTLELSGCRRRSARMTG